MQHTKIRHALVLGALTMSACDTQGQSNPVDQKGKVVSPDSGRATNSPASSKPESGASAPATSAPEKEKRGNTPPGQDRAGQAPASGAIADPSGAATK